MLLLQAMLHEVNSYIRSFKYALENAPFPSFSIVIDADKRPYDEHERRYNAPACNERRRSSQDHRSYDALQYPLLFPYGDDGYHFGTPLHTPSGQSTTSPKALSCAFMTSSLEFCYIHKFHHTTFGRTIFGVAGSLVLSLTPVLVGSPNQQECFFHRLLLQEVVGSTSFEAIRTGDGVVCNTYRQACLKHGLLEDYSQWDAAMAEGTLLQAPATLRSLFVILIVRREISDPPIYGLSDFRQTLPVIPKETRADAVRACLKSSNLWAHVQSLHLTTNMRAHTTGDNGSADFSRCLLTLGEGRTPSDAEGYINVGTVFSC
ncbi:unnamed protein product [Acanthosepion pharaonis]|uniref:ATP-dependent DNA helicase n=1 Tax=Acanthosepion pharaonis TaxID=158019 RepID=A0A812E488_ACAPH|nr:unnamed protein product [Sepia pharaonis]